VRDSSAACCPKSQVPSPKPEISDELGRGTWDLGRPSQRAFDSGYADVIRNAGIVGVGAAWMFLAASFRNEQQQFLKMFIIVYYSMILCISLSVFSIKTAALLWFALGCLGTLPSLQPKGARVEA